MGTEILYSSGERRVVAEPHDLVRKLLWPPSEPHFPAAMESHPKAPDPQGPPVTRAVPAKTIGVPVSDKKLSANLEPEKTAQKTPSQGE